MATDIRIFNLMFLYPLKKFLLPDWIHYASSVGFLYYVDLFVCSPVSITRGRLRAAN